MSGTLADDDVSRRANHEAGHYVAACALGLKFQPLFLTIEPREGSGGRCQFLRPDEEEGTFLCDWVQFLLAGIVTEGFGRLHARLGRRLPTQEELDVEASHAHLQAAIEGGHADITAAHELFLKHTPSGYNFQHYMDENFEKIRRILMSNEHMPRWVQLARRLQVDKTMYYGEANLFLLVTSNPPTEPITRGADGEVKDPSMSLILWDLYHTYKKYRRRASAPKAWYEGASVQYPAGPWYEDVALFQQRVLLRGEETDEEWTARLSIDMDT